MGKYIIIMKHPIDVTLLYLKTKLLNLQKVYIILLKNYLINLKVTYKKLLYQ